MALDLLNAETIVPRFRERQPIVMGVIRDLSPLLQGADPFNGDRRQWCGLRLQQLLAADALLVTSEAAERGLRDLVPNLISRIVIEENMATGLCRGLAPRLPPAPGKRKRIAWVSPLPPTPSGIADYSADMLPELARHFDIDLVVDPKQPVVDGTLTSRFWTSYARRSQSCPRSATL